jgi:2-polyprenyl-6-methoxyphenol hydroxylase-like FAD-dependent oxidoreductase
LPQNITEQILGDKLRSLGIDVFRPRKVTALKRNDHESNLLDVFFETGEVVQASYVIGADGARSSVRKLGCLPLFPSDAVSLACIAANRSDNWLALVLLIQTATPSQLTRTSAIWFLLT